MAAPSTTAVIDLFRMRSVLEKGVIAATPPHHPGIDAMRAAVEEGKKAVAEEDWGAVGTANMKFHIALMTLGDSPRLLRAYRNLAAELRLAFLMIDDPELLHRPFVGRNDEITTLLEANKPAEAAAALDQYLADSERLILASFIRLNFD